MSDDIAAFQIEFANVVGASPQYFAPAMEQSLLDLEAIIKPYPPQPARDRAKTFNTYVRGVGHLPKSAFFTAQGKARKKIKTKGATRTSERLGTKWTHRVEVGATSVTGSLSNNASYAPEVQGRLQKSYHKTTGWVTTDDAYRQAEAQIESNFDRAFSAILEALAK